LFKTFCEKNQQLTLEQSIEYFSILGGMKDPVELDYFDDIFSMVESQFVNEFPKYRATIEPSYIMEVPYKNILMTIARGDGKMYSVFKKARVSYEVGIDIVEELISLNILRVEKTRERPLKVHPKQKLKKELRAYRIQDKLRFSSPFMRFWFGFVARYEGALLEGDADNFLDYFQTYYERLRSLVYEQLSDALLVEYFHSTAPLLGSGSYWNQHSEFDILALTSDKRIILGECKYKNRKVCKNELTKLKAKALQSGIHVDIYALFSKSGFSKELLGMRNDHLLLFELDDLKQLML